jgi:hypothetical protein
MLAYQVQDWRNKHFKLTVHKAGDTTDRHKLQEGFHKYEKDMDGHFRGEFMDFKLKGQALE